MNYYQDRERRWIYHRVARCFITKAVVRDSLEALRWVLEQDTVSSAKFWFKPERKENVRALPKSVALYVKHQHKQTKPGPKVIKLFSCSTQLNTKFIQLTYVKMPTIVDILTFISMINTTSERLKTRNFFICQYFSFFRAVEISCSVELSMKEVL